MEVEVRDREVIDIGLAGEGNLFASGLDHHLLPLHAVESTGIGLLQNFHGLLQALLELRERLLVVWHGHWLCLAQSHHHALRCVTDSLDLDGESLHVVDELDAEKVGFLLVGELSIGLIDECLNHLDLLNEGWRG